MRRARRTARPASARRADGSATGRARRAAACRRTAPTDSGRRSPAIRRSQAVARPARETRPSSRETAERCGCTISSGSRTLSTTLRHGSRFACWNAMPAIFTGPLTSAPAIATVPAVGRCRPVTRRIRVDLPQPDGPTTATNSPRRTFSVIPSRAITSPDAPPPYVSVTPSMSTKACKCPLRISARPPAAGNPTRRCQPASAWRS